MFLSGTVRGEMRKEERGGRKAPINVPEIKESKIKGRIQVENDLRLAKPKPAFL